MVSTLQLKDMLMIYGAESPYTLNYVLELQCNFYRVTRKFIYKDYPTALKVTVKIKSCLREGGRFNLDFFFIFFFRKNQIINYLKEC